MEYPNSSNLMKQRADAAFSTPAGVADRYGDVTTTTDRAAPEFMPSPDRRMSTNYYDGCSVCGGNSNGNRWSDHDYLNSFPPGYRFCPTDTELVLYYLMKKTRGERLPPNIIRDVNLYAYNPAKLIARYRRNGVNEWYFFTPRDRKYPRGFRPNRAAGDGYWKATGPDKPIKENGIVVGSKKVLVFYIGKPPNGTKTNWIMHEYMVLDDRTNVVSQPGSEMRLNNWVLCRIYEKIPKGGGNDGPDGNNGGPDGNNGGPDSSNGGTDGNNGCADFSNVTDGKDHNAMNLVENHGTGIGDFHPKDVPLRSSDVGRSFHQTQPYMNRLRPNLAPVLSTQTGGSVVGRYLHQPQSYRNRLGPDLAPMLSAQTAGPGNGPALCNLNGGAGLNPGFSGHNGGFGFGPMLGNPNGGVGLRPMVSTHIQFGAPHGFGVPHNTDDQFYNSGKHAFVQAPTYEVQPVSFRPPPPQNGGVGLRPMVSTHIQFGAPHGFRVPHNTDDQFYNSGKHAFVQAPTYEAQPVSFKPPPPQNVYPKCDNSDSNILNTSKQETSSNNQMEEGFNGSEDYDPGLESYFIIDEYDSLDCPGTSGFDDVERDLSNQEPKLPPKHGSNSPAR